MDFDLPFLKIIIAQGPETNYLKPTWWCSILWQLNMWVWDTLKLQYAISCTAPRCFGLSGIYFQLPTWMFLQ